MSVDYLFFKTHGQSKSFSEHCRAQTKSKTTSVPFIIHIDFKNIIHIDFYIMKTKKISYTVPTLVLTRVCRTWVMHHNDTPTTLPELRSSKQPRWSESQSLHMQPLSQVRPYELVVLRNHHRVLITSHHHIKSSYNFFI